MMRKKFAHLQRKNCRKLHQNIWSVSYGIIPASIFGMKKPRIVAFAKDLIETPYFFGNKLYLRFHGAKFLLQSKFKK